jgi:cytoskeletal protein CcmA (bactofilin family)
MADTVIGQTIRIDGEILGEGALVVLGHVKGRVRLGAALNVEESGEVEAEVETTEVRVAGQITGNVVARERVELRTGGRLTGDIRSPRILIADGALFKGSIDMDL